MGMPALNLLHAPDFILLVPISLAHMPLGMYLQRSNGAVESAAGLPLLPSFLRGRLPKLLQLRALQKEGQCLSWVYVILKDSHKHLACKICEEMLQ